MRRADAVERLLGPFPDPGRERAALVALLAAAAGPGQPHELSGERGAIAVFSREYRSRQQPVPAGATRGRGPGRPGRPGRPSRH